MRALGRHWSRVLRGAPLLRRLRRRTSVTDTPAYLQLCARAARDDATFATFKRQPTYTEVLEHVSFTLGADYLEVALAQAPHLARVLEDVRRNDELGAPHVYRYGDNSFSPTTLRYLKVLSDLMMLFPPLEELDVVEIGVGYGGQCFVASTLGFRSWTLIDLPPVLELTGRYLETLGVERFELSVPGRPVRGDLVISNYAFSECTRPEQRMYIDTVINRAPSGYMTCNFMEGMGRQEIEEGIPGSRWLPEEPLSAEGNAILVWGTKSM